MPEVPGTDQTATTLPQGQLGYNTTEASPAAFGVQIGQAADRLSQGFALASNDFAKIQALHDTTAVNQAYNMQQDSVDKLLHGDPNDPSKPGFLSLQGQNAIQAWPQVQQKIQEARQTVRDGLQNTTQLNSFDDASRRYETAIMGEVGGHVVQQRLAFNNQTNAATLDLQLRAGANGYSDPAQLGAADARGVATIGQMAEVNGWSADEVADKQAKFHQALYTGAIERAEADSPAAAMALLRQFGDKLGPEQFEVLNQRLQAQQTKAQSLQNGQDVFRQATGGVGVPGSGGGDDLFSAVTQQESGGRQTAPRTGLPITSSKGAIGVSQIMPDTARGVAMDATGAPLDEDRLRTDAAYNATLGKAYLNQMLTRYGGDRTLALAAYNAGPGNVDKWIAANGDPRTGAVSDDDFARSIPVAETRNYVSSIGQRMGAQAGGANGMHYPDDDRAIDLINKLPAEQQTGAWQEYERQKHLYSSQVAQDAAGLRARLGDTGAALAAGHDVDPGVIPTDAEIRAKLPPAQADAAIDKLTDQQLDGALIGMVKLASPDQIAAIRGQAANGVGPLATIIRRHMPPEMTSAQSAAYTGLPPAAPDGGTISDSDTGTHSDVVAPGGAGPIAPGAPAGSITNPTGYRERAFMQSKVEQAITRYYRQLSADPAAYVQANSPTVQAAAQSGDQAAAGRAILAEQARLGVPEQDQHILTSQQAGVLVHGLTSTDPATADTGAQLNKLATQYGDQWPHVFSDMVTVGKLPRDYQFLAGMDAPGQTAARADFQRMLTTQATKGGPETLKGAAGDASKDIDGPNGALNTTMAPLLATMRNNQGGMQLGQDATSAVRNLAYYYASQGKDGSSAVQMAYDGLFGAKYDVSGTMRVPKGTLPQVQDQTTAALAGLKDDDLAPQAPLGGLTSADREKIAADDVRSNATWVPNRDDSGLVAMRSLKNSTDRIPVKLKDGTSLQIRFGDAPAKPIAPPTMSGPAQTPEQGIDAEQQAETGGVR